jgi:hypothetical protein
LRIKEQATRLTLLEHDNDDDDDDDDDDEISLYLLNVSFEPKLHQELNSLSSNEIVLNESSTM